MRINRPLPGAESLLKASKRIVHVVRLESIDSTDLLARRIIAEAADEDEILAATLIIAQSQRKGRGRRGHEWVSPSGGLYLDYLRSGFSEDQLKYFSLCGAVALCRVLEELGPVQPKIKWPNDILLEGGKLGGFLCYALRAAESYAAIGLGLNVGEAPDPGPEAKYPARALKEVLPDVEVDPGGLAIAFVEAFEAALEDLPSSRLAWASRLAHRPGEKMKVCLENGEEISGEFEGVDADGCLLVKNAEGLRKLSSGDIFPV